MKDNILKRLHEIEDEQNIKILYAVESGSRAWGFESEDSDYDIRFIYIHALEWYLSIKEKKDTIRYPINYLLDFHGWDVRKALVLYSKSNPPLYEWLLSPIVYIENSNFAKRLRDFAPQYYSLPTCLYNYLHMAKGENKNYLQEERIKIKKYFYVLRPLFAYMWIEKYGTQPPTEFVKTMNGIDLESMIRKEVEELLVKKRTSRETDTNTRIEPLNDFANKKILYFQAYLKKTSFRVRDQQDTNYLDDLLLDILQNKSKFL